MQVFDLDKIGGQSALCALIDEVLSAGETALKLYRGGAARHVQVKADNSPVTVADRAVEEQLREFVHKRYPEAGFLGEEQGHTAGTEHSKLRFVVDPIDGTRAFMRGLSTWSVLVGLEYEGIAVLGLAFMPAEGDLFVGLRGHGSFGNGRPLRVSRVDKLADACVAHGSLVQFAEADCLGLLGTLATETSIQRGLHDFDGYRQVLLGRADAMVDPGVKPWDVCAPGVLVREAGGALTDFDGGLSVQGRGSVASNGRVHEELLALLDQTHQ